MSKKQFKAESKKLMDMMINSIYTHKEIFLRELISNASDALDKLYFRSLTDDSVNMKREDFLIKLSIDKENRLLILEDNGCGMTLSELENNLGTIAKSGSLDFKNENKADDMSIIGQFGVGFYSAFMVSDKVVVESRAFGENDANRWISQGADGYTTQPCEKESHGTKIILHIKEDTENEEYGDYLEQYGISSIVKKYSDFIRYPIKMDLTSSKLKEDSGKDGEEKEYEDVVESRTLNSMVPLWKRNKSEITPEEYNSFYMDQFGDYSEPAKVIHTKVEGQATYTALLYIPKSAPYDYYSKDFEKGLSLYSSGVRIMDKCSDLLPDYFSFVKGLVDSEDLSLNISREMLQHDRQLKIISSNIEKKIKSELVKLQSEDREKYETFFAAFGTQLKFGAYADYGMNKENLKDLLMFVSSLEKKLVTLDEYTDRMKEGQGTIYYACGESVDKIDMLPQAERVKDKGYEILYLTENVDEFVIQVLSSYKDKTFTNISTENLEIDSEEEKAELKEANDSSKDMLEEMKKALGTSVQGVRFTNRLKSHPVCLSSEGMVSVEMEKVLNSMPNDNSVKAEIILEINRNHPIAQKLQSLYETDKDKLAKYSEILYAQARLIEGLSVENPTQLSNMICDLMV
ncbi:MAG: molecular chaperone HtpG [Oscillospiraceae bacterium]